MRLIRISLFLSGLILSAWGVWLVIYASWEFMVFPPPEQDTPSIFGFLLSNPQIAKIYVLQIAAGVALILLSQLRR